MSEHTSTWLGRLKKLSLAVSGCDTAMDEHFTMYRHDLEHLVKLLPEAVELLEAAKLHWELGRDFGAGDRPRWCKLYLRRLNKKVSE